MKKRILLFTAIAGLGYLVFSSYKTGPGTNNYDCSGADKNSGSGNPAGCSTGSGCHSTSATAGITLVTEIDSAGVTVSSVSGTSSPATGHYTPGFTYTIKITGTNTTSSTLPKFGFQCAATVSSVAATVPANAGTLQSTGLPTDVHYVNAPRTSTTFYASVVEHDNPITATTGTGGTGSTYVESFTWTAPATGTGVVSIFSALNAVNNNGSADAGDLWNLNQLVLDEITVSHVSVANITGNNMTLKVFPNPVSNNLNLQMDNAQAGTYSLYVFDMAGRIITTENIEVASANQSTSINTGNWVPGAYQVTVEKDGYRQVIPVVKL